MKGRFKVKRIKMGIGKTDEYKIIDISTGKSLDMSDYEDVKFLCDLLNDYYLIVKDKWGV